MLVLPTGSGKSVIIADIARRAAAGGRRVLILAHRAELLSQNYEKLAALMPWSKIGLYSASLKRRDTDANVLVAGIQSVYQRAEELGSFALVIIDEVHLVPPDGEGRYRTMIDGLTANNPSVRFLGLSATPWRLGSGLLTQSGGLWTEVAHEVSVRDLIGQGFLAPLVSKAGRQKPDMTKVAIRAGEYVSDAMEQAFNRLDLVEAAVEEIVAYGTERKSWLIFASGVSHAEKIAEVLNRVGIPTGVVTGNTDPLFRDASIRDFKSGRLRALVNCEVLTTGFDFPGIDLIAVLRATQSAALWVQICGRGMRIAEGKKDCLVLCYGGNAARHGPIDRVQIVKRWSTEKNEIVDTLETVPCRECPECRSLVPLASQECPDCGYAFLDVMRLNHGAIASDAPILSEPEPTFDVEVYATKYERHKKKDKPLPTLRADYSIVELDGAQAKKVSEWVCFEHEGWAKEKAHKWWHDHGGLLSEDAPPTVDAALARIGELKPPKKIRIKRDGQYWRVLKVLEYASEAEVAEAVTEEEGTREFFRKKGYNF